MNTKQIFMGLCAGVTLAGAMPVFACSLEEQSRLPSDESAMLAPAALMLFGGAMLWKGSGRFGVVPQVIGKGFAVYLSAISLLLVATYCDHKVRMRRVRKRYAASKLDNNSVQSDREVSSP